MGEIEDWKFQIGTKIFWENLAIPSVSVDHTIYVPMVQLVLQQQSYALRRSDGRWRDGPSPFTVDRNILIVKIQNAITDCRQRATVYDSQTSELKLNYLSISRTI